LEKGLKNQVERLLEKKDLNELKKLLFKLHPTDIATLIDDLSEENKRRIVFSLLDIEMASEVIVELSEDARKAYIVEDLPSDEAADIIAELPKERAQRILARISPEDSEEVKNLLKYHEETAGGLMQTEVVALPADITVEQAIQKLRQIVEETEEEFHNVFIVDHEHKLVGIVSVNRLILARPDQLLSQIMDPPETVIYVDEDQEEVAKKFQKYDLVTAPVVNREGILLGRITIDDIVDVIEEEVSEDLFRMAGIEEAEEVVYTDRIFKIAQMRLPWIIVNILGEFVTGYLLWLFKHTLADAIILVSFIPVINSTAGNAGLQSSSIAVRGWATGRINFFNFKQQFLKEIKVALIMAIICGTVGGTAAYIWHGHKALGLIIGVSMFFTINIAVFWGTIFPALLRKIGLDPAVAAGPFVATLNDIMGVLVYMSIATFFLHHLK